MKIKHDLYQNPSETTDITCKSILGSFQAILSNAVKKYSVIKK